MNRSLRAVRVAFAWLALSAVNLPAQQDTSGRLFELEGNFGYTGVEVEKWANRTAIDSRDQKSYGINARAFLTRFSRKRVGFELGTRQLFRYELFSVVGPTITREKHTVASQHISVIGRLKESPRVNVDFGFGFEFFSEESLPAFHGRVIYQLFGGRKFSLPIGARIDAILHEVTIALPMSIISGAAIKF